MQDTGTKPYPRPARRRGIIPEGVVMGEGEWEDEEEEEEGPVGLEPYPPRAAAILEDAYQV